MSSSFSDATRSLLDRLRGRDHVHVGEAGRTKLLLHGEVRPLSIVLFHGLSASPTQFVRFAHELHGHGHNVIVPRLPRHGHHDRLSEALARLTAEELRVFAGDSVTLAQGIGERVVVAGFSIGGLLATWVAERFPVEHVVAIAPFFGLSWIPGRWMNALSHMFLALPNRFHWWDPIAREKQLPVHGYPRYATHALAQAYMLAHEVIQCAPEGVAAKRLTFVTNARETAVNNRAVRRLEARLRASDPARLDHVVLSGIPFSHDIIEPLRHPEVANAVYPQLLGLIEEPLGL